jgi:hypothetical protein
MHAGLASTSKITVQFLSTNSANPQKYFFLICQGQLLCPALNPERTKTLGKRWSGLLAEPKSN